MWEELDGIVRTIPHKPLWIGGSTNQEVVPLAIHWSWRDEDLIEAFKQWLKERRPRGEEWDERPRVDEPPPKPHRKSGAGSEIRQTKKNLKALAAWRLIQHYDGDSFASYEHPGASKYLGKQFESPGAWSKARATVQTLLRQYSTINRFDHAHA